MEQNCRIILWILILLLFSALFQVYLEKSIFISKHDQTRTIAFDGPQKLFLQMVWVFRSLIADILWLKVDYYHHSKGVGEMSNIFGDEGPLFSKHHHDHNRLLNEAQKEAGEKIHHEHEHYHAHEEVAYTEIKGFVNDERSFKIGDFDYNAYKNIQLYIPEIIPILKLITVLNPHFDRAYSLASYIMIKFLGKEKEGWEFLKEGLKNNPDSPEILYTFASLYLFIKRDFKEAEKYALTAYKAIKKTIVYDQNYTDEYVNDYWLLTLRMLVTIYKHFGDEEKTKKFEREWQEWVEKFHQQKN